MKFILAAIFLTSTAFSATTGTLLLKGVISDSLEIIVVPEVLAANLPLGVSQTGTLVAKVTEKSNSNTGYKVAISSANLGNLKRSGGTENVPYSLSYGGQTVNLTTGTTFSQTTGGVYNVQKNVEISYTGVDANASVPGEYSDVVTFTISAN